MEVQREGLSEVGTFGETPAEVWEEHSLQKNRLPVPSVLHFFDCAAVYAILVLQPRIEPMSPASGAQSLNHQESLYSGFTPKTQHLVTVRT